MILFYKFLAFVFSWRKVPGFWQKGGWKVGVSLAQSRSFLSLKSSFS